MEVLLPITEKLDYLDDLEKLDKKQIFSKSMIFQDNICQEIISLVPYRGKYLEEEFNLKKSKNDFLIEDDNCLKNLTYDFYDKHFLDFYHKNSFNFNFNFTGKNLYQELVKFYQLILINPSLKQLHGLLINHLIKSQMKITPNQIKINSEISFTKKNSIHFQIKINQEITDLYLINDTMIEVSKSEYRIYFQKILIYHYHFIDGVKLYQGHFYPLNFTLTQKFLKKLKLPYQDLSENLVKVKFKSNDDYHLEGEVRYFHPKKDIIISTVKRFSPKALRIDFESYQKYSIYFYQDDYLFLNYYQNQFYLKTQKGIYYHHYNVLTVLEWIKNYLKDFNEEDDLLYHFNRLYNKVNHRHKYLLSYSVEDNKNLVIKKTGCNFVIYLIENEGNCNLTYLRNDHILLNLEIKNKKYWLKQSTSQNINSFGELVLYYGDFNKSNNIHVLVAVSVPLTSNLLVLSDGTFNLDQGRIENIYLMDSLDRCYKCDLEWCYYLDKSKRPMCHKCFSNKSENIIGSLKIPSMVEIDQYQNYSLKIKKGDKCEEGKLFIDPLDAILYQGGNTERGRFIKKMVYNYYPEKYQPQPLVEVEDLRSTSQRKMDRINQKIEEIENLEFKNQPSTKDQEKSRIFKQQVEELKPEKFKEKDTRGFFSRLFGFKKDKREDL